MVAPWENHVSIARFINFSSILMEQIKFLFLVWRYLGLKLINFDTSIEQNINTELWNSVSRDQYLPCEDA